MSKPLIAILAFLMLSQAALAQAPNSAGMNQQGDAMAVQQPVQTLPAQSKKAMLYDERTNQLVEVQPEVAQAQPAQQQGQTNPIYILNNQKYQGYAGATSQQGQGQNQYQEQPTTIVQDSAIHSGADNMRRKRQETESGTEDGIVQALEKARLEDEMRRRDRFNSAIGTQTNIETNGPTVIQQQAVQQQVVAAPAPVPVIVKEEKPEVEIRSKYRDYDSEEARQEYYVAGLIGISKYPDVVNIKGNMSGGFAVGMITPERVVAEGTFLYGTYELEDLFRSSTYYPGFPRMVDMRQYNLGAALKYQLLPGKIRPVVGGVVGYTRRAYSEAGSEFRTSDAVDGGLVAGLDLQLTRALAIGFDFRYMMNIGYSQSSKSVGQYGFTSKDRDVEKLDYYTAGLTGKFTF
jgi:hypothetical protein